MGQPKQYFVAPGEESAVLNAEPSPWIFGMVVRLPQEHWDRIVEFAAEQNGDMASELADLSYHRLDESLPVSKERLERLVAFLGSLQTAIEVAPPLTPDTDPRFADSFENFEHARMVDAVKAVLSESLRTGVSFEAYAEG